MHDGNGSGVSPRKFLRGHAYGFLGAILIVVALATGKALSDGDLSAPAGFGILLVVAALLIRAAITQVVQRLRSR